MMMSDVSWSPRLIADAANFLDEFGGPDGAAEFCPMGLGSADAGQIFALMTSAIALGFGYEIRGSENA